MGWFVPGELSYILSVQIGCHRRSMLLRSRYRRIRASEALSCVNISVATRSP